MMKNTKHIIEDETAVKKLLIRASLFLTAFELLKSAVEDRVKYFLSMREDFDKEGNIKASKDYKDQIIKRKFSFNTGNAQEFIACSHWLSENNAISKDDIEKLQKIRKFRNEIAHNLPKFLISTSLNIDVDKFDEIRNLLIKIEVWWVLEFEVTLKEEYDNVVVNPNDVKTGRIIILEHLLNVLKNEVN